MKKYSILKASVAPAVLGLALVAAPASAQDEDGSVGASASDTGEVIVVTGSRIQRRTAETAAPIAVVSDEEFKLSGTVNVENVINTLPQVVPGTTSFSNNPGNGTATLNLRGLGTNRNLVLVNGRRWMFFDTAQVVDLNTIPNFLIEGVDVVTGGASAVYGSDALTGVVNFRLKDVEGVEVGGQYNLTERGDGARYQLYGAIGTSFDDGRGSATVYGEYYNRKPIFQGDRSFSNFAIGGETFGAPLQQFGSGTPPQGRINAPGTVITRNGVDANGDGDFNDPGDTPEVRANIAAGLALDDGLFRTPGIATPNAGNTYNYAPVNYLQVPQERYLLGGYADYEISEGLTAYTEVSYVNNRVATELAATPVTGTFNIDIAAVSPFLSQGVIDQLNQIDANEATASAARVANGLSALPAAQLGVISTAVNRRTLETGGRNSLDERNAFRVLGGIKGGITDTISYDAYYMYARTRNANIQQGNISRSAFQRGLDGTDPAINIFGLGQLTQDMVDQISIQAQNGDISTLEVANASINGTFGDFAIGDSSPIGFAVGAEYRKVASDFLPDTALSSGDVIGFNAGNSTSGSYSVKELFAELNVPIEFGTARLELTGAGRYSDYELDAVGGVWTYAGGIQFSPIPDIIFRGQYQRAVRAPNVGELFGGQAIGFPGATDRCGDIAFINANPGARQLCVATGVPAGNVGNAAVVQLNPQIPALFGGNPDLQEETSESFTAGVVLQPSFIPGLTVTADYFDITIEDAISVAGGSLQGLFDLCYGTIQDINSPVCQAFVGTRNGDGAITVDTPPLVGTANIASLGAKGVDLEINYNTTIPFSLLTDTGEQRMSLSVLGTWTESAFSVPVVGVDDTVECSGQFGGRCGEPTPSFKWTARASFIDGPLTTSLRWRHLSAVEDNDADTLFTDFNGIERIDAYDLIDLTFSFEANDNLTFAIGVNNLFDTLPGTPLFNANGEVSNRPNSLLLGDNQEQANTYPGTYDVLGRDFFASVAFKF